MSSLPASTLKRLREGARPYWGAPDEHAARARGQACRAPRHGISQEQQDCTPHT